MPLAPIITCQQIIAIFDDCYYDTTNWKDGLGDLPVSLRVEGFGYVAHFDPAKIIQHSNDINAILSELPVHFHPESGGGGGVQDMLGYEQAVSSMIIERLLCLGLATGGLKYVAPRRDWHMFADGMPYVILTA